MSLTEIRTSKLWNWNTLLRDHTRFVSILPNYLAAYVIPGYSLTPATIESVMVTMNTINTCPYCTGLHGQLARMAGVDKPKQSDPEVMYATAFAHESGRGSDVAASYDILVSKIGSRRAQSVRALCSALSLTTMAYILPPAQLRSVAATRNQHKAQHSIVSIFSIHTIFLAIGIRIRFLLSLIANRIL